MKRFCVLVGFVLACSGCNVQEKVDVNPANPDTPVVKKVSAENYFAALADWVEAKQIASPREMAAIVAQLVRLEQLTADDVSRLEAKFSGMTKDDRAFSADDIATLRSLK